jgi:hypothetical protein
MEYVVDNDDDAGNVRGTEGVFVCVQERSKMRLDCKKVGSRGTRNGTSRQLVTVNRETVACALDSLRLEHIGPSYVQERDLGGPQREAGLDAG